MRWCAAAAVALGLFSTAMPAEAETGLMLETGTRAFFGNRRFPREGNTPMAVHLGAQVMAFSGDTALTMGGRWDWFLLTAPDAFSRVLRGHVGYGWRDQGLNFAQFVVGYRHVADAKAMEGGLGSAHGPMFGFQHQFGTHDLHTFWEIAALGYARNDMSTTRVGVEARLRIAYLIGTIEWYIRIDPATGGELGMGLGMAKGLLL